MQYVRLGESGLKVSRIGLGMMSYGDPAVQAWALAEDDAEPIVARAAEAGVTFFDTADMYSDGASEEITGRLLRRIFARRDEYVLATKVFYPTGAGANDRGLSRRHVLAGIDASLRQTAFVSMQNRYNLVNREEEREMIPLCRDLGVGIIPYSPLARGLLAGTRARGAAGAGRTARAADENRVYRPADLDVADAVRAVAAGRGVPPAQVALAWLLGRPGVVAPVIGATRPGHLDDALAATELQLDAAEAGVLEAPYAPHPPGGYT